MQKLIERKDLPKNTIQNAVNNRYSNIPKIEQYITEENSSTKRFQNFIPKSIFFSKDDHSETKDISSSQVSSTLNSSKRALSDNLLYS